MSQLEISLLGTFHITRDSIPISAFDTDKTRALLAYLVLELDIPHRRDALAALLWPESDQKAGLNSLRNALANLRKTIGDREANPPYLLITRETIQFNQSCDYRLDVAEILHESFDHQQPADSYPQIVLQHRIDAVECYRGPFLEGFSIPDSAAFEEWASLWRERLNRRTMEGLRWLAEYYEQHGETGQALKLARRRVELDPWMEEGHCQVMRLLALSGQRQSALRQYQILREILRKNLEIEPNPSATRLYAAIQSGAIGNAPAQKRPAHNLPQPLTSFIGREKEIATLKHMILSDQTRLVTVTGAGGTGKTRLALRVAEDLVESFTDGVWLVELGPIDDPGQVPTAVASALRMRENPDKTFPQALVDFLHTQWVLIILDTCEHLLDAVANLTSRILRSCPQVSILATSREILGIGGEIPFRCPSLELPDPHKPLAMEQCESMRLFAERTSLTSPGFTITEKNSPVVAQICRRLDGIPLAIELAAGRMRVLSVEQIASRLDHAFVLLTGGSRTALPRHQTLKATIEWSYNLLASAERALLLRLSVFSKGWTLDAAETICSGDGADGCNLPSEEILDLLGRLVDKSLILVESGKDGKPRYRMLDTINQYARECLLENGGASGLQDRHLAYFQHLAEEASKHLRAKGMIEWLNRLETELGNLRIALEWSLSGSIEQGLRLGSALFMFWHLHSYRFEGAQWLERLLEVDGAGQPVALRPPESQIVRGVALIVAGYCNQSYPGIFQEHARLQYEEAKSIFRELGEQALKYQPFAIFNTASSEQEMKDCLAISRQVGNDFYTAEALSVLRDYAKYRGDLMQAMAYDQENLAIRQKIGDIDGEAFTLENIGYHEFMLGNPQRAVELWEKSQLLFREVMNIEMGLFVSGDLARAALARGDYRQAEQISKAHLATGQEINSRIAIVDALGFLGWAAWAMKKFDQFTLLYQDTLEPGWENNLPHGRGTLLYVIGREALSQGNYSRAQTYLKTFSDMSLLNKLICLHAIAVLAAARGNHRRAVLLISALDQPGYCGYKNFLTPAERDEYDQTLASARVALGEEGFEATWTEGQVLTLEQIQALAWEETI